MALVALVVRSALAALLALVALTALQTCWVPAVPLDLGPLVAMEDRSSPNKAGAVPVAAEGVAAQTAIAPKASPAFAVRYPPASASLGRRPL